MSAVVNQQQGGRYDRLPQWLRDLQFVTDFFSWLFALFSRLAEPFMLLCTLYIVAEAGVPAIAVPALHDTAIGIMICAPEVILPGSFVVASRAQDHARLLYAICWTFVSLTLLTLISLFVWHFTGEALAWLMCARCAAAVGYSILMRVMHHSQVVHQQTVVATDTVAVIAQFTDLVQSVERTFTDQGNKLTDALQPVLEAIQQHTRAIEALAALPGRLGELERSISSVKATPTPRLSVVGNHHRPTTRTRQSDRPTDKVEKGAFVRRCLTDDPTMRTSDIQRLAAEQGITIAHSYISDIRKSFVAEQSA